jgi:RNA polymerase sigma-70 factor (ECF subfamily)
MSEPSDEQLMSGYINGDTAAFDTLYRRYRGPLYRYLERQSSSVAVAEELYQDVWMRVIGARGSWQQESDFRPWIYRIAHNRMVDHWRSGRENHQPLEDGDVIPLEQPWPDAWLLIQDCIERLFKLLGGLSEPQRSAFLLKEEGGLSLSQIAEVMATGRETIKSRLRYALQRLRVGLEGCDE